MFSYRTVHHRTYQLVVLSIDCKLTVPFLNTLVPCLSDNAFWLNYEKHCTTVHTSMLKLFTYQVLKNSFLPMKGIWLINLLKTKRNYVDTMFPQGRYFHSEETSFFS